jgi:hypothetical protein
MSCQMCGRNAPTQKVNLYQNIGMLVMRTHRHIDGNLCQACISHYFWEYTLVSAVLGWWGMASFVMTVFILPNNIYHRLRTLSLGQQAPGIVAAPLAQAVTPICPRCQSYQSKSAPPTAGVVISVIVGVVVAAFSGLMVLAALADGLTADNLVIATFFLLVSACLAWAMLKLRQHAQRECLQCGVVWVNS